jgi:hypothetical protein
MYDKMKLRSCLLKGNMSLKYLQNFQTNRVEILKGWNIKSHTAFNVKNIMKKKTNRSSGCLMYSTSEVCIVCIILWCIFLGQSKT